MRAIPKLLPDDEHARQSALEALHRVVEARGSLSDEGKRRLSRVESLFAVAPVRQPAEVQP